VLLKAAEKKSSLSPRDSPSSTVARHISRLSMAAVSISSFLVNPRSGSGELPLHEALSGITGSISLVAWIVLLVRRFPYLWPWTKWLISPVAPTHRELQEWPRRRSFSGVSVRLVRGRSFKSDRYVWLLIRLIWGAAVPFPVLAARSSRRRGFVLHGFLSSCLHMLVMCRSCLGRSSPDRHRNRHLLLFCGLRTAVADNLL
jgi:hypothetical protein